MLKNAFGVQDQERLSSLEAVITGMRLVDLAKSPVKGRFDLAHLKRIHHAIFHDLYSWAGKFRTVDIDKGQLFCHFPYIEQELRKLLHRLAEDGFLSRFEGQRQEISRQAAYYLGEINAIHPFRDGNGRTQREFIRELLLPLGYTVNYSLSSRDEMIMASIASFNGNPGPMEELMGRCVAPLGTGA